MSIVNDIKFDSENVDLAWIIFWSVLLGVIPIVAIGGNALNWWLYSRWLTKSGIIEESESLSLPSIPSHSMEAISPTHNAAGTSEEEATSYKSLA